MLNSIANSPAPKRVANAVRAAAAAGARRDDNRWCRYDDTRSDHSATVVNAAVVTVAPAAATRASVPTGTAAAGDRDCQSGLPLVERRERHRLAHGNTEDAEADRHSERKKSVHSFLLWFVR